MKKNLILASIAMFLAVGASIASSFINDVVFVRAKASSASDAITCISTGQICANAGGPTLCRVTVTETLGALPDQITEANTTGTHKVYYKPQTVCLDQIYNSENVIKASSLVVYELF